AQVPPTRRADAAPRPSFAGGHMNDESFQSEPSPELASSLAGLSRWDEVSTSVWQSALERARPRRAWLFRRIPTGITAAAAVLVLGVVLSVAFFSSRGLNQSAPSVASEVVRGEWRDMEGQKRQPVAHTPSPVAAFP